MNNKGLTSALLFISVYCINETFIPIYLNDHIIINNSRHARNSQGQPTRI